MKRRSHGLGAVCIVAAAGFGATIGRGELCTGLSRGAGCFAALCAPGAGVGMAGGLASELGAGSEVDISSDDLHTDNRQTHPINLCPPAGIDDE